MHTYLHNPCRQLQFSLLSLVAAVASVAVGLGAVLHSSYLWTMAISNGTFLLLAAAAVAAAFRCEGHSRAMLGGFSICGGAYLFAVGILGENELYFRLPRLNHVPLATTWVLELTYDTLHKCSWFDGDYGYFMYTGHCLWAVLLGFSGGLLGRYFYAMKDRRKAARD